MEVLCCSAGQSKHYIIEMGSDLVVKPRDYESLAKAVVNLKENPDLAKMEENMWKSRHLSR